MINLLSLLWKWYTADICVQPAISHSAKIASFSQTSCHIPFLQQVQLIFMCDMRLQVQLIESGFQVYPEKSGGLCYSQPLVCF